ncbi:DUF309 domain-containing protein [Thalassobacillus hwangdonensis]|uniref:DUF309 domain-containing protein n=1 Tax=Thalassobacillus hwangdonensis TaxID=546108 RepID=A0ABW3L1Q9_9BACI
MYPTLYIEYLAHFHCTKDFFECHEVLEEHWKEVEPKRRDSVWVALIQLAVSLYHHRRGNHAGAQRLLEKSYDKVKLRENELKSLGLDPVQLQRLMEELKEHYASNLPFQHVELPVDDPELVELYKAKCQAWHDEGILENDHHFLVHKHRLRDRSDVMDERQIQLDKRRNNQKP